MRTMTENPENQAPEPTTAERRAVVVPDKAALEGLEAKWAERWKADETYRFDRTQPRENVYSIDTPPPTVSGSLHVGPRLLLHPHRPHRPLPADARQDRLLPDGLGRQRPADRAPGAELLRRPLRPVAALRRRLHARRRSRTPRSRSRSAGPTSSSCASGSSRRTSRSSSRCGARSASRSTGRRHYTTIGPKSQTVSQTAFLRNFARGEAYLQEAPTLWDVTFQTAVAQAELEARDYAGAYHRVAFHRPDGEPVHIETTRPELIPSVVALIAHPDDERYQPTVRHHGHLAGLRRRDPGARPPGRRARQGRRHRDVLHLR